MDGQQNIQAREVEKLDNTETGIEANNKVEDENSLGGPSFYPPLYIQRYTFVKGILDELKPDSVVDFGSAECGIFRHLKEVVTLLRINLVDLDSSLLEVNKHRIRPCCYDYLQKRRNPLQVQIFAGDATKVDGRLTDMEAVTMVEFIEHLYEEDLLKVVKMVFECINPRIVVMTTPNFEFNQLFPGSKKFRHYDHKFEWTRKEFQIWCNDICEKYNYSIKFYGIGEGPVHSEHLGCCSQAAVFIRQGDKQIRTSEIQHTQYCMIAESSYPGKDVSSRDPEDVLQSEVSYILSFMSRSSDFYNEEETSALIPLDKVHSFKTVKNVCNIQQLREFLVKKNYKVTRNEDNMDCVCVDLNQEDYRREWYGDEYDDDKEDDGSKQEMIIGETNQYSNVPECWD